MFILDDLIAAPFKGVLWILKEVVAAAEEEQAGETDRIKDRLREMYLLLETGQMTEADFDAEESTLLDRLDEIEQASAATGGDDGDGENGGDDEYDDEDEGDDDDDDDDNNEYAADAAVSDQDREQGHLSTLGAALVPSPGGATQPVTKGK